LVYFRTKLRKNQYIQFSNAQIFDKYLKNNKIQAIFLFEILFEIK